MKINAILGYYDQTSLGEYLLMYLGGALILFLITRELWTWYFKINALVENQEKQLKLTEQQNQLLEKMASPPKQVIPEGNMNIKE